MLPSFHDGYLTGLAVSERAATLSICRSDGVVWQVKLSGLLCLKADDFREGNIIAQFQAITGAEPPRELLESVDIAPHQSAAQEYQDKYRAHIDALVAQVAAGSLSLVSITASYGCNLIAICEGVTGAEIR